MKRMKTDTILKLIDAGYTKAEIQAMEDFPAEPQEADEHDKPADEPDQPAPAASAAEEQPAQPAGYDAVLEALNKLTNSIIKSNINATVVQPAEHTLDDALASIIAPPMKKTK